MASLAHALTYSAIFVSKVRFRALFAIKRLTDANKKWEIPLHSYMQWISIKEKQKHFLLKAERASTELH